MAEANRAFAHFQKNQAKKKESELIDIFLETNEKETKDETEIMDQLSPLGDFLKNKKEEPHVNTME
ncbi:hypothetical protein DCAR_0623324 [Daucus carota subsp. sativus]|uniref:Uncharacterized protein n=1 Tax=Daucus carota subsp. sativus TaxID=79200 RepID=A0AAF1B5H3_DAUCS|nr:hypothetical protein DCAR_0623324 [Daucus carota subsp. sativus]